ncbi:MAG TPA: hypothetical protein VH394_20500 [Thermoanaerobaculia bacterium]|nr:hypothetical protein [Thermoanaerobaculia bacterium]
MPMKRRRIKLEALLRLLRGAVGELLRVRDADAFLSWMESQAPERFPEVFSGMDDRVVRPLALELGRQIWEAMPLAGNGSRPLPLPRPEGQNPPAIPGLTPELIGALIASVGDTVPEEN